MKRFDWFWDRLTEDPAPTYSVSGHQDEFRSTTAALDLGPVKVSIFSFPPMPSSRTPRLIRQSDPDLWELGLMTSGLMIVDQEHRQVKVGAGDLLLYDMSRPTEMRVTGSGHITLLHLPKSAVPLADHSVRGLLLRRLPLDGSGALLAGFLQGLAAARWSGLEAERLGSAAVQLASAFLGGLADREEISPQESRKIVLLRQVKTFIAAHLTETRLGPQVIADAHFISVRSLHLLFRAEKQTVSAYIRGERLERCRSDLGQPCRATTPVEAIGARWGFADATSFSRAFKASFGMPPGEYRRWLDGAATVRP